MLGLIFLSVLAIFLLAMGILALIEVKKTDSLIRALVFFLLAMINLGVGITIIAGFFIL